MRLSSWRRAVEVISRVAICGGPTNARLGDNSGSRRHLQAALERRLSERRKVDKFAASESYGRALRRCYARGRVRDVRPRRSRCQLLIEDVAPWGAP